MMGTSFRFASILVLSGTALITVGLFVVNPPQLGALRICTPPSTIVEEPNSSKGNNMNEWQELGPQKTAKTHNAMTFHEYVKPSIPTNNSPYAYVTFLQDHYLHDDKTEDNTDEYFISTRVLGYQLMHSPKTGTEEFIPFVVVCTPGVRESKKKRLEEDGAIIIMVDFVQNPEWMDRAGVNKRWEALMSKLRIIQLTQFEKILFLDSDVLVVDRLDGIFQDKSTDLFDTKDELIAPEDVGKVPEQYMMAAQGQQRDWIHPYPPSPHEEMYGAGFFLTTPSEDLFEYYMHVLYTDEARFNPEFAEQNLINYAHRRDGPMPWQEMDYKWTTTYPTLAEYEAGAKSLHHKWWWDSTNIPEHGLNRLTTMWYQVRGEMEGYYNGLEER